MKPLLLAVLISFSAVCLNAAASSAPKPEDLKLNMNMNAAMQPKQKAKTVEFLGYSQFTTGNIKVEPKLKYVSKKVPAAVYFFEMDNALAFAYEKSNSFDKVEVKLLAKDEDLYNRDPHHVVPVYANLVFYKNNKAIEKGALAVFSVELHEIWSANRPVEIYYDGESFNGDPHQRYTEENGPAKSGSRSRAISSDPHFSEGK